MQKIDHFARDQRIKLLNTQTMKKQLNNDVSVKVNRDESQFSMKKIDENFDKKVTTEKRYFICERTHLDFVKKTTKCTV